MYIVNGWLKDAIEDDYKLGYIGGWVHPTCNNQTFYNDSLHTLLDELINFTGHTDMTLNSCDEDGRVNIHGMECNNGDIVSDSDIAEWKEGKIKLYAVTYTFLVYKAELSKLVEGY